MSPAVVQGWIPLYWSFAGSDLLLDRAKLAQSNCGGSERTLIATDYTRLLSQQFAKLICNLAGYGDKYGFIKETGLEAKGVLAMLEMLVGRC